MGQWLFTQQQVAAHTHTHRSCASHHICPPMMLCGMIYEGDEVTMLLDAAAARRCCIPAIGGADVNVINVHAVLLETLKGNLE